MSRIYHFPPAPHLGRRIGNQIIQFPRSNENLKTVQINQITEEQEERLPKRELSKEGLVNINLSYVGGIEIKNAGILMERSEV